MARKKLYLESITEDQGAVWVDYAEEAGMFTKKEAEDFAEMLNAKTELHLHQDEEAGTARRGKTYAVTQWFNE